MYFRATSCFNGFIVFILAIYVFQSSFSQIIIRFLIRLSLSASPSKWSNTLKQFVSNLSVFDHFVKLALKGLWCSAY